MHVTFSTRTEYEAALIQFFQSINRDGSHTLKIFDTDLDAFSSMDIVEQLHQYFLASRNHRLILVLLDDQKLRAYMPRLFNELKTFAHACELFCLSKDQEKIEDTFVVAQHHLLLRPNRERFHGTLYLDEADHLIPYEERFEELLQVSARTALYTLGL